jgi:hypothetical protein
MSARRYTPADTARMRARLVGTWANLTPDAREQGRCWYLDARQLIDRTAKTWSYDCRTVAAVVAAISPQCEWTMNWTIAERLIQGLKVKPEGGATRRNLRTARKVLKARATSPADYFEKAPKVAAFAEALSGNDWAVVIDRHASGAATGDLDDDGPRTTSQYDAIATAYRQAAAGIGISPCHLQAAVWLEWKRRKQERKR